MAHSEQENSAAQENWNEEKEEGNRELNGHKKEVERGKQN